MAAGLLLVFVGPARATNFAASPNAVNVLGPPNFTTPVDSPRMDRAVHGPEGVALDSTGRVFIADTYNDRVVAYNAIPAANGAVFDYAVGMGSTTEYYDGCSSTQNSFTTSVAAGGGKLAIASRWVSRVVLYNTTPTANGASSNIVLGQPNLTTCPWTSGAPTASSLSGDVGQVWTNGTKVLVADSGNNRVLIWNTWPTSNNQAADLVLGQPDFTSNTANNGGISASRLNYPTGVWSDGTKLLVVDRSNNRVLAWNTWPTSNAQAASFVLGQSTMTGNGTACSAAGMNAPFHVASNGTRIAITETWGNNRVILHDAWPTANGRTAERVLGQTSRTSCVSPLSKAVIDASSLSIPTGISMSSDGTKLLVADSTANRVLAWTSWPSADGQAANIVMGHSSMADAGANDQKLETFVDRRNEPSLRTNEEFTWPFQAPSGQVWVSAKHRILRYAGNPSATNEAPTLQLGQTNDNYSFAFRPNWGLGSQQLRNVQQIWTNGTRFLAVDASNNRVLVWNSYPSSMNQAADLVLGQASMSTNTAATTATGLRAPGGVASDGTRIVVSDTGNHRMLVWNSWPTANGQAASLVLGQPDFTTGTANTGGVSAISLSSPAGLAMENGALAVADGGNHRILIWHRLPTRQRSPADAAFGQLNFTSSAAGQVSSPKSISLADNTLTYTGNCQIRYVDPIPVKSTDTGAVDLAPGCGNVTPLQNTVYQPTGVSLRAGVMWLADQGHGRLLRYDDVTTPTITVAPAVSSECTRQVVTWTTSESGTTELHWGPTSQATAAAYANHEVDTVITGPKKRVVLTTAAPNTMYYYRVQTKDGAGNTVTSGEGSFTQRRCATTQFTGLTAAQSGSPNPTDISTASPRMSWVNGSGMGIDRQRVQVLTTPLDDVHGLYRMEANGNDASGEGRTLVLGTAGAAPTTITGATGFGQAYRLDGNDLLRTPFGGDLDLPQYTVEAWFRSSGLGTSTTPTIVMKGSSGQSQNRNFGIWFTSNTGTNLRADLSIDGVNVFAETPGASLVNGQWHHVAATYDGSAVRLFVDGELAATTTAAGQADLRGDAAYIGGGDSTASNGFAGDIDDVRFSSVARTAAQIRGSVKTALPHATTLWDSDTTDAGVSLAACASNARCADITYGATGTATALQMNDARYYVRAKFRGTGGGDWTAWSTWDWFQTSTTPGVSLSVDSTTIVASSLPGQDTIATCNITVTTANPAGYQLTAIDASDVWGATSGSSTIADWTGTNAAPTVWAEGTSGYVGATVASVTGTRLAKWGTAGSWPATDFVNNRFAGLKSTTTALLHSRTTATGGSGDAVQLVIRGNPSPAQPVGSYDAVIALTAVANP